MLIGLSVSISLSLNNLTNNATYNAEMLALYRFNKTGSHNLNNFQERFNTLV